MNVSSGTPMPMFPLGSVLFPSMPLPLHVFEPRYVKLLGDCLEGDGRFGVVLIERGSEVGGGDVRSDLGTVARLVTTRAVDRDRYAVIAVGERVVDVVEWLPDDPYPRAVVEDRHSIDEPVPEGLAAEVTATLRRVLALVAEVAGGGAPATVDLASDPDVRAFQIAALSPLGPFDHQRLLAAQSTTRRLRLAAELLSDHEELLVTALDGGDGPPS